MSIVVVGAYTRDLYMFGLRLPAPGETVDCHEYAESHGGKGANQAVAAARLGTSTTLITRLGADRIGDEAYILLRDEGLDVAHILRGPEAGTGVGFIIVDQHGQQLITTYAGASGRLTIADLECARPALEAASVLLLQGEISAELSLAAARLAGASTSVILDPGPVEPFLALNDFADIDILAPNEHEAAALAGMPSPTAAQLSAVTGVASTIITRGADGAEIYTGGEKYRVSAIDAEVVDTTGAGDAFRGALAAGLDRGLGLVEAGQHASRCASFSVGRKFCIPSFPTLKDIEWPAIVTRVSQEAQYVTDRD
jgi:ribokinase